MDEADKKSQCLETYYAKRKTMEIEREAKDQIMVQINKYTCNGGRRYQEPSEISKIDPSTDPKVEAEMLSVKMHQTKAISWNQAKSGDDAAEKFVSNDDKKLLAEATQLHENALEQSSKLSLNSKPSLRCEGRCIKSKRSFSRSSARRTGRTTTS